jgi:plastocyanin
MSRNPLLSFTLIVFALLASWTSSFAAASVHEVTMKSISYDPKSIEIKKGDSVEWINKAYTEHSATADGDVEKFDTGLIQQNKTSKKIEFGKAGTYSYHCSVHGKTMKGQIVVTP